MQKRFTQGVISIELKNSDIRERSNSFIKQKKMSLPRAITIMGVVIRAEKISTTVTLIQTKNSFK